MVQTVRFHSITVLAVATRLSSTSIPASWAGFSMTARSASRRSGRSVLGPSWQGGQFGINQQLVEELGAQGGRHAHRTGQRRAQQLGEPGSIRRGGLGEQLLELVHHDQQAPLRTCGVGQQRSSAKPVNPPLSSWWRTW